MQQEKIETVEVSVKILQSAASPFQKGIDYEQKINVTEKTFEDMRFLIKKGSGFNSTQEQTFDIYNAAFIAELKGDCSNMIELIHNFTELTKYAESEKIEKQKRENEAFMKACEDNAKENEAKLKQKTIEENIKIEQYKQKLGEFSLDSHVQALLSIIDTHPALFVKQCALFFRENKIAKELGEFEDFCAKNNIIIKETNLEELSSFVEFENDDLAEVNHLIPVKALELIALFYNDYNMSLFVENTDPILTVSLDNHIFQIFEYDIEE